MNEVFIVSVARTPIGSFGGSLASVPATRLGSTVIRAAVDRAGIKDTDVQEVFMGNVLTAGEGQAPTKQATLGAGLPNTIPCTTVNKVCASGMKAMMLGAQTIMTGDNESVVAGGMESMSQVPYYLQEARWGQRLGNGKLVDGVLRDGLWDPYKDFHMGNAAEIAARDRKVSREEQDEYARASYARANEAWTKGWFNDEVVAVEIPQRKGDPVKVTKDEEPANFKPEKMAALNPAFEKEGTVTAANASKINDGASAVVLMSGERMKKMGLKPLARIVSFADASQAPEWFTTTPAKAMPKAIAKANMSITDMDYFEINEAFSVVAIANMREMNIPPDRLNVFGGAVALGHPIGCSGARIVITLISVLKQKGGRIGCAGICNGGGGASAMVIELVNS